jgi:CRP-like cAMP-binding protein
LKTVPIFSGLTAQELESVHQRLQERRVAAGEVLFHQGDPGDELVIIKSGKIAIYLPLPGKPAEGQALRIFSPGEMLGEMALIDRQPRSASARAEEQSEILTLTGADFLALMGENPEIPLKVMAGLNDRIRYTTDFLGEVRQWVRRIAEGNYQSVVLQEKSQPKDHTLQALAADFAQMAAQVKEREDQLKREVARLRIEIDEAKHQQEVSSIVGSEYFQDLKAKVRALRQQNEQENSRNE